MDKLVHVRLAVDKIHTSAQRALNCGPGLDGLNQADQLNHDTPSAWSEYIGQCISTSLLGLKLVCKMGFD